MTQNLGYGLTVLLGAGTAAALGAAGRRARRERQGRAHAAAESRREVRGLLRSAVRGRVDGGSGRLGSSLPSSLTARVKHLEVVHTKVLRENIPKGGTQSKA
jgi:hypothetical protein